LSTGPKLEVWVESLFFTLSIFHENLLLPSAFFPENEEISAPPPCAPEYIYFMKIGQPTLSERKIQRSGPFIAPTMSENDVMSEIEDYGSEWSITFKAKRNTIAVGSQSSGLVLADACLLLWGTSYFLASRCKMRLIPRSKNDSGKNRRNQKA